MANIVSSIKSTGWVRSRLRDCGWIAVLSGALALPLGAACSHMPWNSSSGGVADAGQPARAGGARARSASRTATTAT